MDKKAASSEENLLSQQELPQELPEDPTPVQEDDSTSDVRVSKFQTWKHEY